MYAVDRYTSVNDLGTAVLFQQLIDHPVARVVTASSMSIYGEGLYRDRRRASLRQDVVRGARNPDGSWDPQDERGRALLPVPTPETKQPALASVYAIGKYVQETADPDPVAGLRHGGHGAAPVERLRSRPGPLQPLYRRPGDLRLAPRQRPAADGVRGRPAAPRLRPCERRGARLPAGARSPARGRPRSSTSAAAKSAPSRRSRRAAGRSMDRDGPRAGHHRQGPRRRHPPLHPGPVQGADGARLRAAAGFRRRPGRTRRMGRPAGGAATASPRRGDELEARGLVA